MADMLSDYHRGSDCQVPADTDQTYHCAQNSEAAAKQASNTRYISDSGTHVTENQSVLVANKSKIKY